MSSDKPDRPGIKIVPWSWGEPDARASSTQTKFLLDDEVAVLADEYNHGYPSTRDTRNEGFERSDMPLMTWASFWSRRMYTMPWRQDSPSLVTLLWTAIIQAIQEATGSPLSTLSPQMRKRLHKASRMRLHYPKLLLFDSNMARWMSPPPFLPPLLPLPLPLLPLLLPLPSFYNPQSSISHFYCDILT